jgi:hypothetical protein
MAGNSSMYRYALILIAGLIAGLLLTLSWPRLSASLRYLPIDTAISNYRISHEIDPAQLNGLIERAEQAIEIHDHYRYWAGLSELQILSGQLEDQSVWQRRQALENAAQAAEEVVRRAPSKPRAWLRIARAREFLAYPADEIIPALKMSILTGRVEPTLMLVRLELGLRHLPSLDEEAVRLMRDQAALTWAVDQKAMLKQIKAGVLNLAVLQQILANNHPTILAEMEAGFVK